MITVVLDTNVLASGSLARSGTIARVLDAALAGHFQLVLSQPILTELERTLHKEYFATRLDADSIKRYIELLKAVAHVTALTVPVSGLATHPEDDLILATAFSGAADFLVTGDQHLQGASISGNLRVVSPSAFLDLLRDDLDSSSGR